MDIGVLGTGNAAHAFAADITLAGHDVYWGRVGSHSSPSWEFVLESGICYLKGVPLVAKQSGAAKIKQIGEGISHVIKNTNVIFIATTADRHVDYMHELMKFDLANKLIVFIPGRFASLRFLKILREKKKKINFTVAETSCLPYVTRISGLGEVRCIGGKSKLPFAAFPSIKTKKCLELLQPLFPIFTAAKNVLETSIMDHCSIIHPISATTKINLDQQQFPCYGFTHESGELADELDNEKMNVQKLLNMNVTSIPNILKMYYDVNGGNSYTAMKQVTNYKEISNPGNLNTRYLHEDVPFGLIPNYLVGKQLGIDMSFTKMLIDRCCSITRVDYFSNAYTLEDLGLLNKTVRDVNSYLMIGNY